jgi:hypothetical protein
MTADLQRCRDEQIRCVTLLLAGHPEQHGLRMGLADWMMEEVLLLTEQPVALHTETERQGLRIPASNDPGGVSPTGTARAFDTCGEVIHETHTIETQR